jgi:hypothetical protein
MAWVQLLPCNGHPKAQLAPNGSFLLKLNLHYTLFSTISAKYYQDKFFWQICVYYYI